MKKNALILLLISILCLGIRAQEIPLTYFLPEIQYNPNIPTPKDVFGFQVGERHLTSDLIRMYLEILAEKSDRMTLEYYAVSHEKNPLILLTVTSPENHSKLEELRQEHLKLTDPELSDSLDTQNMPVVIYQGYSIHGNESSGANASPLWAYYLAAAETTEVQELLKESIILVDPYMNPDGLNRFATWVNLNRGELNSADVQERGHYGPWPSGRTNHYLFDMNRDWITTEHPESKGRIKTFHRWKPNFLTDHHEMGTSKTYFFQPGVPERVHPLTLDSNQELTSKIAKFHAAELDRIGSLYYSGEGYDDYYYGKGSAYPDVNGGIGILFEQASTGGPIKASPNGDITFPYSIRNQIQTSFSTVRGVKEHRVDLLEYQREFFKRGYQLGKVDTDKAYIFQDKWDKGKLKLFIELLLRHKIEVYRLGSDVRVEGMEFKPEDSYLVPLHQRQYRMVKSSFETVKTFTDSIFYDVSSWTLPLAHNLNYAPLKNKFNSALLGERITDSEAIAPVLEPIEKSTYAYLFRWDDFNSPKALALIQAAGLRTKVAMESFKQQNNHFERGTILVPVQNQEKDSQVIFDIVQQAQKEAKVQIYGIGTGFSEKGVHLGSPSFNTLKKPKIAMIVGSGMASYDAGHAWYLLDKIYKVPMVKLDIRRVSGFDLSEYNTLVMTDGLYTTLNKTGVEKIKEAVENGAMLIAMKNAVKWAEKNGLVDVKVRQAERKKDADLKYNDLDADYRSMEIKGTILQANLDITNPIGFGYKNTKLPTLKREEVFLELPENLYAAPLTYGNDPLLSGYLRTENYGKIKNSAGILLSKLGKGRVICFADNPNFRMFWKGTVKLFANAIFFGNIIDDRALEAKKKPKKKAELQDDSRN